MADAPASIYPPLHTALVAAIDHRQHDAISPTEVKIFFTPAGEVPLVMRTAATIKPCPANTCFVLLTKPLCYNMTQGAMHNLYICNMAACMICWTILEMRVAAIDSQVDQSD